MRTLGALAAALLLAACGSNSSDDSGTAPSEHTKRFDCPAGSAHRYYTEHNGGDWYTTDDGRKVTTAGELAHICD